MKQQKYAKFYLRNVLTLSFLCYYFHGKYYDMAHSFVPLAHIFTAKRGLAASTSLNHHRFLFIILVRSTFHHRKLSSKEAQLVESTPAWMLLRILHYPLNFVSRVNFYMTKISLVKGGPALFRNKRRDCDR